MHEFISKFRSDNRGAVAMIFGFVLVLLCLFAGLAVDVARAYSLSSFVASALHSSASAAALALGNGSMDEREAADFAMLRYKAFVANRNKTGTVFDAPRVTINRTSRAIDMSARATVDTYFAVMAGKETFVVREETVARYRSRCPGNDPSRCRSVDRKTEHLCRRLRSSLGHVDWQQRARFKRAMVQLCGT